MKSLIMSLAFIFFCFNSFSFSRGTDDIKSMKKLKDGSFQVFCVDNTVESLNASQIENGEACSHIKTIKYLTELISQDVSDENKKLCEYEIQTKESSINDYFFARLKIDSFCSDLEYDLTCTSLSDAKVICENKDISAEFIKITVGNYDQSHYHVLLVSDLNSNESGDYNLLVK